ncbi:MAG: autotransporter-associated beta strand repeat-containing protein, partial [Brevundimonas sp.]
TIASDLSASGDVEKTDLGTLILSGDNQFSGAVTVRSGELRLTGANDLGGPAIIGDGAVLALGDGGLGGSVSGEVFVDGGTLRVNRSNDIFLAALTGTGALEKDGAGVMQLQGGDFAGTVTVLEGTLHVSGADVLADASIDLAAAGAVLQTFSITDATQIGSLSGVEGSRLRISEKGVRSVNDVDTVFAGTLESATSANSNFTKAGAGVLTLTANQDALGSAGSFNGGRFIVEAGTLAFAGDASAALSWVGVGNGARFDIGGIDAPATRIYALDLGTGGVVSLGDRRLEIVQNSSYEGLIEGEGGLDLLGGSHTFDSAHTFTGGLSIGEGAGLDLTGDASLASAVEVNGSLSIHDHLSAATIGGLSGAGQVSIDNSELVLTDGGVFSGWLISEPDSAGSLRLGGGVLDLRGDSSDFTGTVTVETGATLTGSGTIGGLTTIEGGAVLAGHQGQTLTMGELELAAGSIVNVRLGSANDTDALFDVTGDLTLDGTLNVTDAGGFGAGVYRLFDYGGDLTDNGLDIASAPDGVSLEDLFVQTSVASQVNLVSSHEVDLRFWDGGGAADDGAVQGGSGTWSLSGRGWTGADGAVNGAYDNPAFAVFMGTGGTVTVDGAGVGVTGMQFAVDGYAITGDGIELTQAETIIRVGDGTAAGAAMTATIASSLTGAGGLVKTDLGTLTLTGINSYQGGTVVRGGTLIGNTDSLIGDLDNDAVVVFDQSADADFAGDITGDGETIKRGDGVLSLLGANAMDWSVETGGLRAQAGAFSGDVAVASGANFTLNAEDDAVWAGVLTGSGAFAKTGAGGLLLTGNSSAFDGITEIRDGLLVVNGALGGQLRLFDGAMLGGSGALGQLT